MSFSFSIWPVLITAVLLMPLGAFLYSEKGLGKMWLDAIGKTSEDINPEPGEMMKLMGTAFVSSLIVIFLIGFLIQNTMVANVVDLLLVVFSVYFIVFFIRLKGSIFDGNMKLFKVNLMATFCEFLVTFIVFIFFI